MIVERKSHVASNRRITNGGTINVSNKTAVAYSNVISQNLLWGKRNITEDINNSYHWAENRARDLHIIIPLHPLIFSLALRISNNMALLTTHAYSS
jgi:hypothetical protein